MTETQSNLETSGTRTFLSALAVVCAFALFGCIRGGGSITNMPDVEQSQVNLRVYLGGLQSQAAYDPGVILNRSAATGSSSAIRMTEMVVTFTSNLRDTLRDTISMLDFEDSLLVLGKAANQNFEDDLLVDVPEGAFSAWASVSLPPLRWWNVDIKTFDSNDSLIHHGIAGPFASRGNGQSVNVSIPVISPRFTLYQARYTLPEAIFDAGANDSDRVVQGVYFSRLVMLIDGEIVRDSTSFSPSITSPGTRFIEGDTSKLRGATGRFFFRPSTQLDTVTHLQSYMYVTAGERTFTIRAYGFLEGDTISAATERLLYIGEQVLDVETDRPVSQTAIPLQFNGTVGGTGRPVECEPVVPGAGGQGLNQPGCPDWTGVAMTVTIGRTKTISLPVVEIPGEISF